MSPIWARSRFIRAPGAARMQRVRSKRWYPATSSGSRPGGSATRCSPMRPGGVLDDLMVSNQGDHLRAGGQRRLQGGGRGASARASFGRVSASSVLPTAPWWRCRDRRRKPSLARLAPGGPRLPVHGRPHRRADGRALPGVPFRLYRRGRLRDQRQRRARPKRCARRCCAIRRRDGGPRSARYVAARSGPVSLRGRPHPRDHAGGGGAGMDHRPVAPRRRRSRRRLSGRRRDLAAACGGSRAPAGRSETARPRAGARRAPRSFAARTMPRRSAP